MCDSQCDAPRFASDSEPRNFDQSCLTRRPERACLVFTDNTFAFFCARHVSSIQLSCRFSLVLSKRHKVRLRPSAVTAG